MLRLSFGNSANLFRVRDSEELVVAFCLRVVSAVFTGLLSGRLYSAAKLTVVALACGVLLYQRIERTVMDTI